MVCVYVEMSSTIYLKTAVLQREEGWTCNIHDSGSIHNKVERYLQTKTQRSVQCTTHNFIPSLCLLQSLITCSHYIYMLCDHRDAVVVPHSQICLATWDYRVLEAAKSSDGRRYAALVATDSPGSVVIMGSQYEKLCWQYRTT